MAQHVHRSKPRGATGPMHPKPPKLQNTGILGFFSRNLTPESYADLIDTLKFSAFTLLFMLVVFGLLIWSAS